jgi:biopolymer transport protein TolR
MAAGLIGGGRRGRNGRYRAMSDINVTPLVDVMLVLLIVFMVTAPMLTSGVNVDLPKTSAQPVTGDATPLTVTITADGRVHLGDEDIDQSELVAKLTALAGNDMARRIFVRGDRTIPYGQVMQVMAAIASGGFTKVALLAEQTQK